MITMVSHRMMDKLSCMLRANDEADMQGHSMVLDNMQAQLDSELARENILMRQQLLESAAENNAISKSLQERVRSLADTTDAKIKAETEVKLLQVHVKSMQNDLDAHQYELHLLRKQVQIRNEEKEHHKKASDASYKQHLENVKKIARLESECQRLRGLIRQRLPGPAAIAQMRAECDIHVKVGIKKKAVLSSKSLHNSSSLQAQREIEGLKERLLSVEDEAKFLKEAMTKRTTELQEARQLCARTAMKLSAAQALVESMTSTANTMCSTPSTPTHLQSTIDIDGGLKGESNGVCALSYMHTDVDARILDVNSELKSASHNNDDELDEVSCAESWASALFAELSHLSNLHEDTSVTNGSFVNPESYANELSQSKKDEVICNANVPNLEINSALEMVHKRLSTVGETLLVSCIDQANMAEETDDSESFCSVKDTNPLTLNDRNHDLLEEILQIKGLLMDISTAIKMGNVSSQDYAYAHVNGDEIASSEEPIVKQEGQKLASLKGGRGLSRLRYSSLEDEREVSSKFSEDDGELELLATNFMEQTIEMENLCTKLTEETAQTVDVGAQFSEQTTKFGDEFGMTTKSSDDTDMCDTKFGKMTVTNDDSIVKSPTRFSEDCYITEGANTTNAASAQLNLAAAANDKVAGEESDLASELEADVELQSLLHSTQAELALARGRIATLEAELASCMQEKADMANELADTTSLKQSLEVELAGTAASMEDLKLQLSSSLQALITSDQEEHLAPFQGGRPTLAQVDVHPNMKEEQELAAARAQLADCQRSIHVIRNQIATEMEDVAFQDVISDEQVLFDTSSESSKSTDLSSHLPSPIPDDHSSFVMPSSNTLIVAKPMEDALIQRDCNKPHFSTLSKSCGFQEDDNSQSFREVDEQYATKQQTQQNHEECKGDDDIKSKGFMYLTRPSSKEHVPRTTQSPSKPVKSSTTSRISEFFNRAKSTPRGSNYMQRSNDSS